MAVLECAAEQSIDANFADPAQKRALRAIVKSGLASIVRTEGPYLYARLTTRGISEWTAREQAAWLLTDEAWRMGEAPAPAGYAAGSVLL